MSGTRLVTGDWATLGADAARVRTEVFVHEQRIPAEMEWDAADAQCLHCVVYDGEIPVGTGRLLPDAHIGRMAVLASHRRHGLGSRILSALVEAARRRGDSEVELSSQSYVCHFYAAHGFESRGEPYDEVGIEHQRMVLSLGDERSTRVPMPDGAELHVRDWLPAGGSRRGVYLIHGLGEHIGRYEALARWFNERGWRVRGHDHVGHGQSTGRRGVVARSGQMMGHAQALIAGFAGELDAAPVVLGQSLGGALAAALAQTGEPRVGGLILSAPALELRPSAVKRALAALLLRIAPTLALDNGIDVEQLSRDPAQVRAYVDDPLVHRKICARMYDDLDGWGRAALLGASRTVVPTLLLVPAADRIVSPRGAKRFAGLAPQPLVRLHEYPEMRHEPFHELAHERALVLADVERWLDALAASAQAGNG